MTTESLSRKRAWGRHPGRNGAMALLALLLGLSACGSSSKGSTSAATSSGLGGTTQASGGKGLTASAPGITSSTISIGLLASLTGPAGSSFDTALGGAEARVAAQNAAGGVDGRKLALYTADDQTSLSQNAIAANTLLQKDHVFAIAGDNGDMLGSAKTLLNENVPVAGDAAVTYVIPPYNADEFNVQGNGSAPTAPPVTTGGEALKQLGVSKVAVLNYTQAAPYASNEVKGFEAAGLSICYQDDSISTTSLDFTPLILAMKRAGCQAVFWPAIENADVALSIGIHNAGADIKQIFVTGYDQTTLSDTTFVAAAQGSIWGAEWPVDLNNTADQNFLSALQKYDSQYKGGLPDFGTETGWTSIDLLIQGLEKAGPNPTRGSVVKDLRSLTSYDANGLIYPAINYSVPTLPPGPQCGYYVQLNGSQFVPFPATKKPICGSTVSH